MCSIRKIFAFLIATCFLLSLGVPASAAGAELDGDASVQEVCYGTTGVDYVHISSSSPRSASGHGWWATINSACAWRTATVTVQIQRRNSLGIWVNVGQRGTADVQVGGGSGNRATARYTCQGTARNTYRSWADVDIHGVFDSPDRNYSAAQQLSCS